LNLPNVTILHLSTEEKLNLNVVQRDGLDSAFSEVPTTDSTEKEQDEFTERECCFYSVSKEEMPQRAWIHERSFGVGGCFRAGYESQLLDTRKYDSVSAALIALNAGEVDRQSFCLVLSRRRKTYYILWPSGKTKEEVIEFIERYTSSPVSTEEKLNLNGVHGDGLDLSSFSEVPTTDSTPECRTADARSTPRANESFPLSPRSTSLASSSVTLESNPIAVATKDITMTDARTMTMEEFPLDQSDFEASFRCLLEKKQSDFTKRDSSSPASKEEMPQRAWIHERSFGVGGCLRAGYESQLLDTRKYDSVSAALIALNAGEVDRQSFCLVLSRRRKTYYILWPSGKTKEEVIEFIERYNSSPPSKEEKLDLNGVQRKGDLDSTRSMSRADEPSISWPNSTSPTPRGQSSSMRFSNEEKLNLNGVQRKGGLDSTRSMSRADKPFTSCPSTTSPTARAPSTLAFVVTPTLSHQVCRCR
jgi:hypothetical protein